MVKKRTHKVKKQKCECEVFCRNCFIEKKKHELVECLGNTMVMILNRLDTDYFGCSADELFDHVESLFKDGMNWENFNDRWTISIPTPRKEGTNNKMNESEIIANFHYSKIRVTFLSDVTYSWP
jgi:hypothetical protein